MKFDFALILTSLTLIAGLVWLIDHLIFARPRAVLQREGEEIAEPVIVDWSRSLFPVLLFVLVLRSFFFEPFRIPSSSMMPTLHVGDFILVNKFAYGVRLPVVNKKIFETGAPERGDVVVFRYPGESADDPDAGVDYIKRIIGLPGDLIQVADNKVSINGKPVNYRLNGVYVGAGPGRSYTGMKKLSELLFDGPEHAILSASDGLYSSRSNGTWQVPQGMYFVLGDNRDDSRDSRYWGFVPEANLAGRATLIWLNCSNWLCVDSFDYSRIGDTIR